MEDADLLRQYAREGSDTAFSALVDRHLNLIYGAALRQVRNPSLAEDVTQAVFIILAKGGAGLSPKVCLPGWLYRVTRFAAAKATRAEFRRRQHEQEAAQMQQILNPGEADPVWEHIAPLLDEAMAELHEPDCNALLLRYFQNKNLKDVGLALGLSEDAAQKRISRAIVKLRSVLAKRSPTASAALAAGVLATRAAQAAAPAQLGATVKAAALGASAHSPSILWLVKQTLNRLLWPKIQAAASLGLTALFLTGALVVHSAHRPALMTTAAMLQTTTSAFQATPAPTGELLHAEAGKMQTLSSVPPPATVSAGVDSMTGNLAALTNAKAPPPGTGSKAPSAKVPPALQAGMPALSLPGAKTVSLMNSQPPVYVNSLLLQKQALASTNMVLDTNAIIVANGATQAVMSSTINSTFSRLPARAQPPAQRGSQPPTQKPAK